MKITNVKKLAATFSSDCKEFSIGVAYGRLRRDCPIGKWETRRKVYEDSILRYLQKTYRDIFGKYKDCPFYPESEIATDFQDKKIWVMWWQGKDQMPPVVKSCYNNLILAAGGTKLFS